eukprot:1156085-Pelagomonas_calceolata.AAC.3
MYCCLCITRPGVVLPVHEPDVMLLVRIMLPAHDMEAAADFSQQRKQWGLAHRCYGRAADLYMSGGRHTTGGRI